jgi:pimeloyl-ACP methyl ester carboxylesterase
MAAVVAEGYGDRPVEVWSVNYPGYGGSAGPARLASIGPAALAAYDELARRAAGRPVIVGGQSLGTAAALHVAANRPGVAGMVLYNPPPLRRLVLQRHGWWNLWLAAVPVALSIPDALDSIGNAKRSTASAVFVLAGADGVVPPKYQRMVVDAYAGEKRVVRAPGAGHNDPLEGAALAEYEAAVDWMWARLPHPASTAPATRTERP